MSVRREHVKIEGLDELNRALTEFPRSIQRSMILQALRRAAKPIVDDARRDAPRGSDPKKRGSKKQRRTKESTEIGHAADSIKARAVRKFSHTVTMLSIGPSARHWYLAMSEYGTSRQAAKRFMLRAWLRNRHTSLERFARALGPVLERKAAQIARKAMSGTLSRTATRALTR